MPKDIRGHGSEKRQIVGQNLSTDKQVRKFAKMAPSAKSPGLSEGYDPLKGTVKAENTVAGQLELSKTSARQRNYVSQMSKAVHHLNNRNK